MSGNELQTTNENEIVMIADLTVRGLLSAHSRRIYALRLRTFIEYANRALPTRTIVQNWIQELRDKGMGTAALNQSLSAVKKLAEELGERDLLDRTTVQSILSIKGVRSRGVRTGNWLTIEQVRKLLDERNTCVLHLAAGGEIRDEVLRTPEVNPLPKVESRGKDGKEEKPAGLPGPEANHLSRVPERDSNTKADQSVRDRALFAVMIGCGLRRAEVAGLTWDRLQMKWDRWVWADIKGKGGRVRTVAIPDWVMTKLESLKRLATIKPGGESTLVFGLSESGVWWVVTQHAKKCGFRITPHDTRRTYAALAKEGGADVRQIQAELGHSSLQTTERYLGTIEGLKRGRAAGDHIRIG